MNEEKNSSSLAELLRLAKKRRLLSAEITCDNGDDENWQAVSREIASFEEGKGEWPSDALLKCFEADRVPFSAFSHTLGLAIRNKDVQIVEKIIASSLEVDDGLLVDALLLALRDKNARKIVRLVLQRNLNQSPVINRLRQSASIDDCLCLLEEAAEILASEESSEDNFCEQSVMAWVQALLDSHFFGFAQRLGFSSSSTEPSSVVAQDGDIKARLDAALEKLLSFVDDRARNSQCCNNLLSLVESSIALVHNRLPSAARYCDENGKAHRDYAIRLITL